MHGLVNVTNTGIIRSINSFNIVADGVDHSEGITVGGGTVTNSGTIEGLVSGGNTNAIGLGITFLGNEITTGPLAGTREAIYRNATVTNQSGGLIRGDSGSGILVDGATSAFTVTVHNDSGATIRGGATLAGLGGASAAIQMGAGRGRHQQRRPHRRLQQRQSDHGRQRRLGRQHHRRFCLRPRRHHRL